MHLKHSSTAAPTNHLLSSLSKRFSVQEKKRTSNIRIQSKDFKHHGDLSEGLLQRYKQENPLKKMNFRVMKNVNTVLAEKLFDSYSAPTSNNVC